MLLIVLSVVLIAVIDWMASLANGWVRSNDGVWGGNRLGESPWAHVVTDNGGMQLDSRNLLIRINGDQLTARYTVTVPSSGAFAMAATRDDNLNSGNDLVNNVLGAVKVGQFHYGFTDNDYYNYLSFEEPQLAVTGKTATVTVESEPFRLYLSRQRLAVDRRHDIKVSGADNVDIKAPRIQVADISGAAIREIRGNGTTLTMNFPKVGLEIWEGSGGQGWLAGLRALGNISIPVFGYFLNILRDAFVYLVLLWSLSRAAVDETSANDAIRTARRVTLTIVGGLSTIAILWTILRVSEILTNYQESSDYIVAGPMGLLVAGSVVWWLTASIRVWRRDKDESPKPESKRDPKRGRAVRLAAIACTPVALGLYAWMVGLCPAALAELDVPASREIPVILLAAMTAVLAISIARIMLGGWVLSWLVSVPVTALMLAAVVGWPLLWYSSFNPGGIDNGYVNVFGKWTYLAVVAAVVIGLSVMFAKVFWVVTKPYGKPWQWAASVTVAAGIALAVLPDAISESGVISSRSDGLQPYDLFNFFLDLPSLLSWLLIVTAFLLAIGLRSGPGKRPAVRLLAIPIALELFYGSSGLLYLPVERLLGLPLIIWLLLPRRLATDDASHGEPSAAVKVAVDQWRNAEFMAGQRQALASSGTDTLRDLLLRSNRQFDKGLAVLAGGQAKLSGERDRYRRDARKANKNAFSRYGRPFSGKDARAGFIVGAILGIIPATVIFLTTQPPDGSGRYPVLFFLAGTAWHIGVWALLGCFVGYFQPLIYGENGVEKGAWMFVVYVAPWLAVAAIWDDSNDWAGLLIAALDFLVFLVVAAIILDDLRVLRAAGLRVTDWTRVHNWRFVVTWSTAVIAAIGTAAATFLSTAATDLSQQTVGTITNQVSTSSGNPNASSAGSSAGSSG